MALALSAAASTVRRDANAFTPDVESTKFQSDLLARFGVTYDEELLRRSRNIGFPELAETLLGEVPIRDPELLVLAYALPDSSPPKTVSAHLNHLTGGRSRSFAVSDQGLRAPFTALRIAAAYARSGRCADLALFICEQSTFPYPEPFVRDTVTLDSAVLLYFSGQGGYRFRETRPLPPGQSPVPELEALARQPNTLVVTSPRVPSGPGPNVHRSPPGTYCTSVWLELARHHAQWSERYQTVVLCDTDPRTGWSQTALLTKESP